MKNALLLVALFFCGFTAQAQQCEGGLYLNPQVIRGEGASQTESALKELVDFIRPTGLSVTPVLNIRETQDVLTAVKKPAPPCWVYGNPVVGLASGYRPVAVNMDPIQSAVLILADIGTVKDGKPVELKTLPAADQAKVLAKLKTTSCFGMKSGVTTSLVKAESICGTVVEILPQQGLGQSYLPTKAAFHWQADRWAGLITRLQSAQAASMKSHHGTDERIHMAQLVIVPTTNASWGYGLYVHPGASADAVKKAAGLFDSLKNANPLLLKALDLGAKFDFETPSDGVVEAMKKSLAFGP
ncbi:hypothetical protein DT070_19030 [Polaromonas sp. SP1]|nr:hypothetical protein [Polaromonas sp. SP1]AYQ29921.1 hypothetical protein DT070_19030 [Polaromonas sp. SP1]